MKITYKTVLISLVLLVLASSTTALDLNSSEALQYYNDNTLEFQVDVNGNADILGNLKVTSGYIQAGGGPGRNLAIWGSADSARYWFQTGSYDLSLQKEDGSGGYITGLNLNGASGNSNINVEIPNGDLNMNGNSVTNFFGNTCSSGEAMVDISNDGSFSCVDLASQVSDSYVSRSGDTMNGSLNMQGNPITNVGAGNIDLGDGSGDINLNGERVYNGQLAHFRGMGISDTLTNAQNNLDSLGPNSLYVADDIKVGGDIIGTGGDVAENVRTEDQKLEPGTVATISGNIEVKASTKKYDTGVAGVVSTDPGVKLARQRDGIPLALSGIVPVKATVGNGEIQPGDLLTTSDREGYAMKCKDRLNCQGAIIGKAMGSLNKTGKVDMLVTLG